MNAAARRSGPNEERGFALLVLLGIVGMASLTIVLAVQRIARPFAERAAIVDANLATAQSAARIAYRRNGSFPASLTQAANAAGLDAQGRWRVDPWGQAQDLDWAQTATGLRVRSRGTDGVLGSADDEQLTVDTETQLRTRQRGRLRLLRAQLLRSAYRLSGTMGATEQQQMRTAMRDHAIAMRQYRTADAATRTTLAATLATAATQVDALVTAHALPPLPPALTGAGGLMQMLGTTDGRAVDGAGAALLTHATLGVVAAGADGTGGTDDDM
ncbi:MAG: hypothetical protein JNK15_06330 [Planctomycetes bacterium]|nr:hypothetical protein [Planctomycetota bacterium]